MLNKILTIVFIGSVFTMNAKIAFSENGNIKAANELSLEKLLTMDANGDKLISEKKFTGDKMLCNRLDKDHDGAEQT